MDQQSAYDLDAVLRFTELAASALSAAREEIDALNVYPVPDSDTGTNLFLTVEEARDAVRDLDLEDADDPVATVLGTYARALLLAARGNSGVILSQLVGALFKRMAEIEADESPGAVFADGLARAADAGYAAVGHPVEGTMLSVARAAAEAAAEATRGDPELDEVVGAAATGARAALERTPDQLTILRQAGVVDAGGRGLCVLLDAAETALTGRTTMAAARRVGTHVIPAAMPTGDLTPDGPSYEVMYLLDADDAAIPTLRTTLDALGDSLVVVGGDRLWNVHVHTDDVGSAVEAGIAAGRPRRIRVTHFAEQAHRAPVRVGRAVVVVAAGPGLARLFEEAGATVLESAPSERLRTAEMLEVIKQTGAAEVIVLPNDPDSISVSEAAVAAAADDGVVRAVVVPTRAQVQGLAALAVHEPGRAFDADVVAMTSAARGTRHGAVTIATNRAMTSAGACEPGDVLGAINSDFAVLGSDRFTVATEVLRRLLDGGGELVTIVGGAEAGNLPDMCEGWVLDEYPGVDVVTYDGHQERYPLLLAVE